MEKSESHATDLVGREEAGCRILNAGDRSDLHLDTVRLALHDRLPCDGSYLAIHYVYRWAMEYWQAYAMTLKTSKVGFEAAAHPGVCVALPIAPGVLSSLARCALVPAKAASSCTPHAAFGPATHND